MDKEHAKLMKNKMDFFMNERVKVHISLYNGGFYNGEIIKAVREDVYWIEDRITGEVFIFVEDIRDVDKYTEKKEGGEV